MTWIKWGGIILVAATLFAAVLAGLGFLYTLNYIRTPPVETPDRPILSFLQEPLSKPLQPAPWESTARAHQRSDLQLQAFLNPPLAFGPWVRWWWPGNLVETTELQREIRLFAKTGIAGVEIQPFAITVSAADKASDTWRSSGWDSPAFYRNLHTVLVEAREQGMEVDLNNGSGWPTGGPQVALEDGMRQLLHSELLVRGPRKLSVELAAPDMPLATFAAGALGMVGDSPMQTFVPEQRELVAVVAGRIVDNQRSWQPWDLEDQIALDPNSLEVLSSLVVGSHLDWQVPAGEWAITALWQLPGGELVSGGYAHPRPGYVVDHLDADRMRANQDYLFRPETGLASWYGAPLRAVFNDSLEFRQERHWGKGHLEVFEHRRGYDPRPWLAQLVEPGKDQMPFHALNVATRPAYELGESGQRFLEDWDLTTADMFRQRYFEPLQAWAGERQLAHRLQAYGGPVDIIRAAGESDIPETEQLYAGGSEMFMKTVSSGAHIHNKPIISAESFVFMGRAFMATPMKIKALADKAFAAGVNQLIYHGTAYRLENPAARGYPQRDGWYPWHLGMISTDYSEYWPFWQHAARLNQYIARIQYLLRLGAPETDVLVLYPGVGFPQGYNNPAEPFDQGYFEGEEIPEVKPSAEQGGRGVARMRATWRYTRTLEQQGLAWEWVNEHALATATFENGEFRVGALRATALVMHDIEALEPATAERIATLAKAGLPLQVHGPVPVRQRGLLDARVGDRRVISAMTAAQDTAPTTFPAGPLRFAHTEIKTIRRRLANGDLVQFFSNPSKRSVELSLNIAELHNQAVWLDPWSGDVYNASIGQYGGLSKVIPAYGSAVLWLRRAVAGKLPEQLRWTAGQNWPLTQWSLSVAEQDYTIHGPLMGDWRHVAALKSSGGQGIYQTSFQLPADIADRIGQGRRYSLDITRVYGAATVTLNGQDLGVSLLPPFSVDLTPALRVGQNELQLNLVPPRKNRLVPAIENSEPGWDVLDITGVSLRVAAGIIGPISIQESLPLEALANQLSVAADGDHADIP